MTQTNLENHAISLNHENLELLCLDCHNKEHGISHGVVADGLTFNKYGELVKNDNEMWYNYIAR